MTLQIKKHVIDDPLVYQLDNTYEEIVEDFMIVCNFFMNLNTNLKIN